jgi:hypothetical protein
VGLTSDLVDRTRRQARKGHDQLWKKVGQAILPVPASFQNNPPFRNRSVLEYSFGIVREKNLRDEQECLPCEWLLVTAPVAKQSSSKYKKWH